MADKTAVERFDDTTTYIHKNVSSALAVHIGQLLTTLPDSITKKSLGDDISLSGGKAWWHAMNDAEKRRALRALLLCQSVYFSEAWVTMSVIGSDRRVPFNARPANMWKTSIEYWRTRSEIDIIKAIGLFVPKENVTAEDLATAATDPGEMDRERVSMPDLKLTRDTRPFPGHKTCYSAVIYWMFKAGIVSYRWFMRNKDTKPSELHDVFGLPNIRWARDKAFNARSVVPAIPKGHVVHLYDPLAGAGGFAGHWLVSNGDGRAYGCNNDYDCDVGKKRDFDLCNLDKQFLAYKGTVTLQKIDGSKQKAIEGNPVRAQEGVMESFDPMEIPDRM